MMLLIVLLKESVAFGAEHRLIVFVTGETICSIDLLEGDGPGKSICKQIARVVVD